MNRTVLMTDADIPLEVKRELMRGATASGSISYYWLCDIYRRGFAAGAYSVTDLTAPVKCTCAMVEGVERNGERRVHHDAGEPH